MYHLRTDKEVEHYNKAILCQLRMYVAGNETNEGVVFNSWFIFTNVNHMDAIIPTIFCNN